MPLPPAVEFTFTPDEAAALQAIQMKRQAKLARGSPFLLWTSLAAPVVIAALVFLADFLFWDGEMPGSLFVAFMGTFVAGMFFMVLGFRLNLMVAKKRLRETTRQLHEPRELRLTEEGIEQSLPAARSLQMWPGLDRVETRRGLLLAWAGNMAVAAVPLRAFPSPDAARAFIAECQARLGGGKEAAQK